MRPALGSVRTAAVPIGPANLAHVDTHNADAHLGTSLGGLATVTDSGLSAKSADHLPRRSQSETQAFLSASHNLFQ